MMTDTTTDRELYKPRDAVLRWLLDSDPSVRWQVMRDLTEEPEEVVASERARVVQEGWGAQLLTIQLPEGHWGDDDTKAWMRTTDTLRLLMELGLDPQSDEARRAIGLVRDRIIWWQLDGRPYFDGETEPCINGRILAAGAYFGEASDRLLERLLDEQLPDGGWNCEAPQSQRSSFHTTICVLEGLLEFEKAKGPNSAVTNARTRGQEYMLERRMFRSLSTGEVIDRSWTRFAFPLIWHYDLLRGLDYLRNAGLDPDERVAEAVEVVAERQHQNGRWPLHIPNPERIPFSMEPGQGKASRWNTLRALRVLKWYSA